MSSMSIAAAVFALAAVVVFWIGMSYRGFSNLRNSTEEAFSAVEIYMKKRRTHLLKLIKLVKKHGDRDLSDVAQNAADAVRLAEEAGSLEERIVSEGAVAETIKTLFTALDAEETLKEDKRCVRLRQDIEDADRNIVHAATFYNTIAKMLNQRVHVFPSSLIAKLFHFTGRPLI